MDVWQIPGPWEFVILTLGTYRLVRLVGWDEFPLVARIRAWLIGERWVAGDADVSLPGKTPDSELEDVRPAYDRPVLAHLVHCPFCLGWWTSLAVYVAWLAAPRETLYVLAPFALSGAVGLIAKNLDP